MKVIHIVPGSGGSFYCPNCLRDSFLVKALRKLGHDAVVVPLYLPIAVDDPQFGKDSPVFFGGVNVYLQHRFPVFRRSPRWFDRVFDSGWVLARAAKRSGSVEARRLASLTLSMLRGEHGNQAKELERLVKWLGETAKPEIIHISNALLLGLVPRIREALRVPIVCSLQDEDVWVNAMDEQDAEKCWAAMSEKAEQVDLFVSVSGYYAKMMQARLGIQEDRMRVVPAGTDIEGHEAAALTLDPPVVGFLSRLGESLGLNLLVDAFIRLKEGNRFPGLKLRATGGMVGGDCKLVRKLRRKLAGRRLLADVEFLPDFSRQKRMAFLRSLSVLCVPVVEGEAFGLFMVEAMASGVPVVQPRLGGFPELIEETGGGVVYEPNDAATLALTLGRLLSDPGKVRELGRRGRESVLERFSAEKTAARIVEVYEECVR